MKEILDNEAALLARGLHVCQSTQKDGVLETVSWEENLLCAFGLPIEPDREKYGPILKTGYLDMIPRSAFWKENGIYWFE